MARQDSTSYSIGRAVHDEDVDPPLKARRLSYGQDVAAVESDKQIAQWQGSPEVPVIAPVLEGGILDSKMVVSRTQIIGGAKAVNCDDGRQLSTVRVLYARALTFWFEVEDSTPTKRDTCV